MSFIEKFNLLPEEVKNLFASNEPRLAYEKACFLYDISEEKMENMAQIIADIFLKNLPLEQLPIKIREDIGVNDGIAFGIAYEISKKVFALVPEYFQDVENLIGNWNSLKSASIIPEGRAWEKVLEIEPWILEEEKEKKKQDEENFVKLNKIGIEMALDKYPNINNQILSSNQIKIEKNSDLIMPSIKNWIMDFHDKMGVGKHSPVDRGNYLFHSENGKSLTPAERQKVGIILKSLDDNIPLNIDIERQMVVFEGEENSNKSSGNALGTGFHGNDNLVHDNNNNELGEPRDIFDLKVNVTGKTLQKISSPEAAGVTLSAPVKMDLIPPKTISEMPAGNYSLPRENAPVNLPTESDLNKVIENNKIFKNDQSSIGTSHFNEVKDDKKIIVDSKIIPDAAKQDSQNPGIQLKNISFSPNFVAAPKDGQQEILRRDQKQNTLPIHEKTSALKTQLQNFSKENENTFSIPGSKPPLGSEHYDINRAKEEKVLSAIENKVLSTSPIIKEDIAKEVKVEKQIPVQQERVVVSPVNNNGTDTQNIDSLSDEMLMNLYKENKAKAQATPYISQQKGFHIGPMRYSDIPSKKVKNVVNLKEEK